MKKINIINGPNLNLLGKRETEIYGKKSLDDIINECKKIANDLNIKLTKIEVHISNIYNREEFRKNSFISPVVDGIIAGFGTNVYQIAIYSLINLKHEKTRKKDN